MHRSRCTNRNTTRTTDGEDKPSEATHKYVMGIIIKRYSRFVGGRWLILFEIEGKDDNDLQIGSANCIVVIGAEMGRYSEPTQILSIQSPIHSLDGRISKPTNQGSPELWFSVSFVAMTRCSTVHFLPGIHANDVASDHLCDKLPARNFNASGIRWPSFSSAKWFSKILSVCRQA